MKVATPVMLAQLNSSQSGGPTPISRLQVQVSSPSPLGIQILSTVSPAATSTGLPAFAKIMTTTDSTLVTSTGLRVVPISSPVLVSGAAKTVGSKGKGASYHEIRPLIKNEPVDDSYESMNKSQASSESLSNLKNVISSRLTSFDGSVPERASPKTNTSVPMPAIFPPFSSPNRVTGPVSNQAMPLQIMQPPLQNKSGNNYRFVPVGPPMALPNVQFAPVRIPGFSVHGLVPVTSGLPILSSPSTSLISPTMAGTQGNSSPVILNKASETIGGPVVLNAKSVSAPMNGQLLTLPQAVAKRLTLNKALALKINNKQITVPPSGFFQSSEGLKVFLPPNTFPNESINPSEDENNTAEKDSGEKSESHSNTKTASSGSKSEENRAKGDIKQSKHYIKCCLLQKLYGGFEAMEQIFRYLSVTDLLR